MVTAILILVALAAFTAYAVAGYRAIGRPRKPYSRGDFAVDILVLAVFTVFLVAAIVTGGA